MVSAEFRVRWEQSSKAFAEGVKPILEDLLRIRIYSIEDEIEKSRLAKALDQGGIDAYYFTQDGQIRGLASRMRYAGDVRVKPEFSLRYSLFDVKTSTWGRNSEFQRKLKAANSPEQFTFFPKYHVESYAKRLGKEAVQIGWAFATETKALVNYAALHIDNPERVRIWEPRTQEQRKVISIYLEPYAQDRAVIPIKSHRIFH